MAANGKHKAVPLGRVSQKQAENARTRIEHLLNAQAGLALDPETARWIMGIGDNLHAKLARHGLVAERVPAAPVLPQAVLTLGKYLDDYALRRTDAQETTHGTWWQACRNLLVFFSADRPLATITSADAKDFERYLATPAARCYRYGNTPADAGLGVNTIRSRIKNCKTFFADAARRGLLPSNPFAGFDANVGASSKRDYFVTRKDAAKVLDACGDDLEWKVIFVLSRFGGLRCPSETLALKWEDVNWDHGRFLVHSPKTAHHEGMAERLVPIFPELRPHLEALFNSFDQPPARDSFVITRYRDKKANLRTHLHRLIKAAGLIPWPKLFQNLRANRGTELAAAYPAHVAAAWLGHSIKTPVMHYWRVTDADFEKAARESGVQNGVQECVDTARQHLPATSFATADSEDSPGNEGIVTLGHPLSGTTGPKGMSGIGLVTDLPFVGENTVDPENTVQGTVPQEGDDFAALAERWEEPATAGEIGRQAIKAQLRCDTKQRSGHGARRVKRG